MKGWFRMAYFVDLFSPDTYEAFQRAGGNVSGFRLRHQGVAGRVKVGDKLVCYMTKLSRWFGVLEVLSEAYFDDSNPIFTSTDDPFVVRFKVRPIVWLPPEKAIPIRHDGIWNNLSFTKGHEKTSHTWTGKVRGSLNTLDKADGQLIEQLLLAQVNGGETFPVDQEEYEKYLTHVVRGRDKDVVVSVPQDSDVPVPAQDQEVRESIKIQALLTKIGASMGLKVWLPRNDRSGVAREWKDTDNLLQVLPLNYDEVTLKTVEQIDVIWLRGRSIVRAFEVEHTTSIYSGILRMADLLALQPNMNIKLHIVAPEARRDKVFQEIRRPVFSLLEAGPLAERCTFLSYDAVRDIAGLRHLGHLSDSVLEEYTEEAE
ncbi:MAG: hypothetical protein U0X20_12320 [Caldilineaceae bacterium]